MAKALLSRFINGIQMASMEAHKAVTPPKMCPTTAQTGRGFFSNGFTLLLAVLPSNGKAYGAYITPLNRIFLLCSLIYLCAKFVSK